VCYTSSRVGSLQKHKKMAELGKGRVTGNRKPEMSYHFGVNLRITALGAVHFETRAGRLWQVTFLINSLLCKSNSFSFLPSIGCMYLDVLGSNRAITALNLRYERYFSDNIFYSPGVDKGSEARSSEQQYIDNLLESVARGIRWHNAQSQKG
jgi:hypothetical protein